MKEEDEEHCGSTGSPWNNDPHLNFRRVTYMIIIGQSIQLEPPGKGTVEGCVVKEKTWVDGRIPIFTLILVHPGPEIGLHRVNDFIDLIH